MAKNKKIAVAIIAGVLTMSLGIGTALAASTANPQATDKGNAVPAQQEKAKQGDTYTHEDLVKTANEVSIDISGKTDEQILSALKEFKLQQLAARGGAEQGAPTRAELEQKAREVGVDPTGLSDDELHRAIKETLEVSPETTEPPTHEELARIANEVGIDISSMTDDQIMQALDEYKRQQIAARGVKNKAPLPALNWSKRPARSA